MWKIIKWQDLYDSIDKDINYDQEDLEMLEEIRNSNYISLEESDPEWFKKEIKKLQNAAKNYQKTKKIISIRLDTHDIEKVKKMAEEEWMPYQTLLSAIIHKIANWKIEFTLK